MKDREKRLLKEYVKAVIAEDDTGGYGYVPTGGYGFGMSNYGDSLKNVFIDPFIDAAGVIKASGTKLATRVKTLATVAIETILTTMIPFLKSNYTAIFKKEKEELQKIKEKYKKYFEGVDRAFVGDTAFLAFMISPTAFITTKTLRISSEAVVELIERICEGDKTVVDYMKDVASRLKNIQQQLNDDPSNYRLDPSGNVIKRGARSPYMTKKKRDILNKAGISPVSQQNSGMKRAGITISEDAAQGGSVEAQKAAFLARALANPEIKKRIDASPAAQAMKKDAMGLVQRIDQNILGAAKRVLNVKTLQDLQAAMHKPINIPNADELQGEDKENLEHVVLAQVKAAMKEFYVKSLKDEIARIQGTGVDANNLYIRALNDTLSKVAAM